MMFLLSVLLGAVIVWVAISIRDRKYFFFCCRTYDGKFVHPRSFIFHPSTMHLLKQLDLTKDEAFLGLLVASKKKEEENNLEKRLYGEQLEFNFEYK